MRTEDRISLLVVLVAAGCLALLVAFGHVAVRMRAALDFPYQMDPEEGFILNQAILLNRGETIYPTLKEPPFIAGTYAPLYQFLTLRGPSLAHKALASVFPFAASDRSDASDQSDRSDRTNAAVPSDRAENTMYRARLPAVISELACGILIGIGVFAMGRRQIAAALFAGLLFFASCDIYNWTGFARVDFMALAFNLAGLLFMGRAVSVLEMAAAQASQTATSAWASAQDYQRAHAAQSADSGQGRKQAVFAVLGAGACFTLALFTKQSQIMAPLAGCLFLIWRRPRWGFVFAPALALSVLAIAGLLHWLTGGQYLRHTILFNKNVFYWQQLLIYAAHLWRFGFLIWLALACFALAGIMRFIAHRRLKLVNRHLSIVNCQYSQAPDWTLFFLLPCLLSLLGFAKAGVSYNYMIDPWAAICLYLGVRMGNRLTGSVTGSATGSAGILAGEYTAWHPTHGSRPITSTLWSARIATTLSAFAILLSSAYPFFILTPFARDGCLLAFVPPQVEWEMDSPIPPRFTATASNPGPRDVEMGRTVDAQIKVVVDSGGTFLTELPIFEIRAGRPVTWQPFIMAQLAREGKWSDAPLVERFAGRKWNLLVAGRRLESADYYANYTEGMLEAIRKNYRFRQGVEGSRIFNYYFYFPER